MNIFFKMELVKSKLKRKCYGYIQLWEKMLNYFPIVSHGTNLPITTSLY